MRTSLAIFLLAAVVASLAVPAQAAFIPPAGLAPGSQFQMIFVTSGYTTGESSSIATYNSFVASQAAPLIALFPSSTWTAIGSTTSINANVNAPNDKVGGSYLPVYNTAGILVSSQSSGGLYAGSLLAPVNYDQTGATQIAPVWTGSTVTGTKESIGDALGQSSPETGEPYDANLWWITNATESAPALGALYGLSSILTVPSAPAPVVTASGATGQIWNDHNPLQQPVVVDSGLTVSSSEADLSGASMTISSGLHADQDFLNFTNANGITGSYNSHTGVLTLSGSATPAQYQAALESVTFSTVSGFGVRSISVVADDAWLTSNTAFDSVVVLPEPSTLALLGMAFLLTGGMWFLRRR